MLERLTNHFAETVLSETQCGFRKDRDTTDMIFSIRQIQEKFHEQNRDLYLSFIDLTKASDTVNRELVWSVLHKFGTHPQFLARKSFSNFLINHSEDFLDKIKREDIPENKRLLCVDIVMQSDFQKPMNIFYQDKLPILDSKMLSFDLLANLYMEYFENVLLPDIKPAGMFWFRYANGIFIFWDDIYGSTDVFLAKHNNSIHNIKLKVEWKV
ncbi:uncharacterized protein LOC143031683 [Oratosquilla oratoria]|uniref:uncharacterized protein LOC143031683 n=1 Tax=Oratosquilla oratoria TaxID=337810 RepID=UPI003F76EAC0